MHNKFEDENNLFRWVVCQFNWSIILLNLCKPNKAMVNKYPFFYANENHGFSEVKIVEAGRAGKAD